MAFRRDQLLRALQRGFHWLGPLAAALMVLTCDGGALESREVAAGQICTPIQNYPQVGFCEPKSAAAG